MTAGAVVARVAFVWGVCGVLYAARAYVQIEDQLAEKMAEQTADAERVGLKIPRAIMWAGMLASFVLVSVVTWPWFVVGDARAYLARRRGP